MEQKELKEILSNFGPNSGTQLKYYIITSLYPSADKGVIKDIGDFNAQTFSRIATAVRELALPPLVMPSLEAASEQIADASPDIDDLQKKFDDFVEASAAHEFELIGTIEQLKKERDKLVYDLQGAQMKIEYLQSQMDTARSEALRAEKVKF